MTKGVEIFVTTRPGVFITLILVVIGVGATDVEKNSNCWFGIWCDNYNTHTDDAGQTLIQALYDGLLGMNNDKENGTEQWLTLQKDTIRDSVRRQMWWVFAGTVVLGTLSWYLAQYYMLRKSQYEATIAAEIDRFGKEYMNNEKITLKQYQAQKDVFTEKIMPILRVLNNSDLYKKFNNVLSSTTNYQTQRHFETSVTIPRDEDMQIVEGDTTQRNYIDGERNCIVQFVQEKDEKGNTKETKHTISLNVNDMIVQMAAMNTDNIDNMSPNELAVNNTRLTLLTKLAIQRDNNRIKGQEMEQKERHHHDSMYMSIHLNRSHREHLNTLHNETIARKDFKYMETIKRLDETRWSWVARLFSLLCCIFALMWIAPIVLLRLHIAFTKYFTTVIPVWGSDIHLYGYYITYPMLIMALSAISYTFKPTICAILVIICAIYFTPAWTMFTFFFALLTCPTPIIIHYFVWDWIYQYENWRLALGGLHVLLLATNIMCTMLVF